MRLKFTQKLKGLSPCQRRTFATVCAAGFFNNYDGALLSLVVEQIQRGLKISEAMLPRMASLITLGSLFAPLITSQADRLGRRKLLLASIALQFVKRTHRFRMERSQLCGVEVPDGDLFGCGRLDRDGDAG